MRNLDFVCEVTECTGSVVEPQFTQIWESLTRLIVTAHITVNAAASVEGRYVRVSHKLNLGYFVSLSQFGGVMSQKCVTLTYIIDGLKVVRAYDIALKPKERIVRIPSNLLKKYGYDTAT